MDNGGYVIFIYFDTLQQEMTTLSESNATIEARLLVNSLKPKYPLDVVSLATQILKKPAEIHKRDFPVNICAVIYDKPEYETIYIGVNSNRPIASQRFSVVHELGHRYLDHKGDICYIEDEEDPVLHAEADDFAAEVLVPKSRISSLAKKYQEPMSLIRQILIGHNVSLEVACRRLIDLGTYNGAFVCFDESETFFTYNTSGFILEMNQIKSLPTIKRGCIISQRETINGLPVTCYLQRFKTSGKLLAAVIEEDSVIDKKSSFYKKLIIS